MTSDADPADARMSYTRRVLIALGLAAAVFVLLFFLWQVGQALLALFASGLVGVFLSGCSTWLSGRTGLAYGWCLLIVVLAILALAAGAVAILAAQLVQQAEQLYEGLRDTLQGALEWIQQTVWGGQLLEQAEGDDGPQLMEILPPALEVLWAGLGGVGIAVVITIVGLYLAGDPHLYRQGALCLVPPARRDRAREVIDAVVTALRGWLLAQFVSMAVIGTLVAVGLWLMGIEMWLILGLLAGVLTFIPNLGPIIAGIPPVLIALNQSVGLAVGVVAYFTAVQMFEGYFVTPMVQHRVIRLPPAAILGIQLIMAYLFGMLGIAVAAPLLAAIMVAVEMLYVQDVLGDRDVKVTGQESGLAG